jgi:hypothetical protein
MIYEIGTVANIAKYFLKFGYECPFNFNPADYLMVLAQTESFEKLEACGLMEQNLILAKEIEEELARCNSSKREKYSELVQANMLTQIYWVAKREVENVMRDRMTLIVRFFITITLNLIYGLIFLNSGNKDDSNSDNFNAHYG